MAKPLGRPSGFTQKIADEICDRIAHGESLRSICRDMHMPETMTVYRWLLKTEKYADFCYQYARAREVQADYFMDEITDIADDGTNDWEEREGKNGKVFVKLNPEAVQRSKLRIETRCKRAGQMAPKKYNDKTIHEHTGKNGEEIVVNVNISEKKRN